MIELPNSHNFSRENWKDDMMKSIAKQLFGKLNDENKSYLSDYSFAVGLSIPEIIEASQQLICEENKVKYNI